MVPATIHDEDVQDNSSSDEDFNPENQAVEDADSSSSSESDNEGTPSAANKTHGTKRRRTDDDHVDATLDSGDEATIQERKKARKRSKKKAEGGDDEVLSDDEGGEGGFVRTRAQRRVEKVERRALATTKGATIDVESVWSRLSSLPIGRVVETAPAVSEDEYITIKRTTRFAGQISTEEKKVLKSSKEARLWLEEQEAEVAKRKSKKDKENKAPSADEDSSAAVAAEDLQDADTHEPKMPLRRPLKRPLKWDPNPLGEVKGLPPNLQLHYPRDRLVIPAAQPPQGAAHTLPNHRMLPPPLPGAAKLNTVQKSKYDWASYVDKNKLAEELDEYGRSKQSYAGRTDFLNRAEGRREEQRLAAAKVGR